jgi:hypothetical protein
MSNDFEADLYFWAMLWIGLICRPSRSRDSTTLSLGVQEGQSRPTRSANLAPFSGPKRWIAVAPAVLAAQWR